MEQDTISLLQECSSGAKMASRTMGEALAHAHDPELVRMVGECKGAHDAIAQETAHALAQRGQKDPDPPPLAKGMAWAKSLKLGLDPSDPAVADLLTDGCNMGAKALNRELNRYPAAGGEAKRLCERLICLEETLAEELRDFL